MALTLNSSSKESSEACRNGLTSKKYFSGPQLRKNFLKSPVPLDFSSPTKSQPRRTGTTIWQRQVEPSSLFQATDWSTYHQCCSVCLMILSLLPRHFITSSSHVFIMVLHARVLGQCLYWQLSKGAYQAVLTTFC